MGAVDVKFWGSMSANDDGSEASFQTPHVGEGPGSYRATIQEVKRLLDNYADQLERIKALGGGMNVEAPPS